MFDKTINEIALTVKTVTDIGLFCQYRNDTTTFPTVEQLKKPNEQNTAWNRDNQPNNFKVRYSDKFNENKRDQSSNSQRSDDEK